ncbi:hypothetical protein PVAG01_06371 [Phlyctema vagabunda]|uniref:Transmembrane protein n=1 Tax=Phlyctema vagabunda TaxID=108571 RepID=A0ABR4PFY3_9HELO
MEFATVRNQRSSRRPFLIDSSDDESLAYGESVDRSGTESEGSNEASVAEEDEESDEESDESEWGDQHNYKLEAVRPVDRARISHPANQAALHNARTRTFCSKVVSFLLSVLAIAVTGVVMWNALTDPPGKPLARSSLDGQISTSQKGVVTRHVSATARPSIATKIRNIGTTSRMIAMHLSVALKGIDTAYEKVHTTPLPSTVRQDGICAWLGWGIPSCNFPHPVTQGQNSTVQDSEIMELFEELVDGARDEFEGLDKLVDTAVKNLDGVKNSLGAAILACKKSRQEFLSRKRELAARTQTLSTPEKSAGNDHVVEEAQEQLSLDYYLETVGEISTIHTQGKRKLLKIQNHLEDGKALMAEIDTTLKYAKKQVATEELGNAIGVKSKTFLDHLLPVLQLLKENIALLDMD